MQAAPVRSSASIHQPITTWPGPMSVFTSVDRSQLASVLQGFPVGRLRDLQGISTGIENSNYHVWTDCGRYVLTLFETVDRQELPYFLELTRHYAAAGLPCARPIANGEGRTLFELNGRPAVLVEYLRGASVLAPDPLHCRALGAVLARLHQVGATFPHRRINPRGARWRRLTIERLRSLWSEAEADLADSVDRELERSTVAGLPRGTIHCDLFRDNVLFDGAAVSGVLDFYYACDGPLLYDLAIAVNDWCRGPAASLEPLRFRALLDGYQELREIGPQERRAWRGMLMAAAARFWLSRALDLRRPREGVMTYAKDPAEFLALLETHRAGTPEI